MLENPFDPLAQFREKRGALRRIQLRRQVRGDGALGLVKRKTRGDQIDVRPIGRAHRLDDRGLGVIQIRQQGSALA